MNIDGDLRAAATAMIEERDYKLPNHEQPQPQQKADPETLDYLESLPWRPIGVEW